MKKLLLIFLLMMGCHSQNVVIENIDNFYAPNFYNEIKVGDFSFYIPPSWQEANLHPSSDIMVEVDIGNHTKTSNVKFISGSNKKIVQLFTKHENLDLIKISKINNLLAWSLVKQVGKLFVYKVIVLHNDNFYLMECKTTLNTDYARETCQNVIQSLHLR